MAISNELARVPPAPPQVIRFGGVPSNPSAEVFAEARMNNPAWYQTFEQAYKQFAQRPENQEKYADPEGHGATLEQIWRLFTLLGHQTHCVLVRDMPDD